MTELKPCPFCGCEAKIVGSVLDGFFAYCPNCGAGAIRKHEKAEAIAAWNTRAETLTLYEHGFYLHGVKFVPERTCRCVDVNGYRYRFECSLCGYVAIVQNCDTRLDELPNYCPNCGAKVVGE